MNSNRISRFRKRTAPRDKKSSRVTLLPAPDSIEALFQQETALEILERIQNVNQLPLISDMPLAEVDVRLSELDKALTQKTRDDLFNELKSTLARDIAGKFGVGKLVGALDKKGGNVDTIHNARNGIYATNKAESAYINRGEYHSTDYHNHSAFRAEKTRVSTERTFDSYMGRPFRAQDRPELDHTVSAREIHDDPGRVLAGLDGPDLANRKINLNLTQRSINRVKRQKSVSELSQWLDQEADKHTAQIIELSQKRELTPTEAAKLQNRKDLQEIDVERMHAADKAARADINKTINRRYYGSRRFTNDLLWTSATEAGKLGFQQAFGMMLAEFFVASVEEVQDWYSCGKETKSVIRELWMRLNRVAKRVTQKWQSALSAFGQGFISGFLSGLVTTLINTLATTGKRAARMLREGCFSLLSACNLLFVKPNKLPINERLHEVTKVLVAGGIVVAGVLLEEFIDTQLRLLPFLLPVAEIATTVIVGSITAIATTSTVALLDNLDLFGAKEEKHYSEINAQLELNIKESIDRSENIMSKLR